MKKFTIHSLKLLSLPSVMFIFNLLVDYRFENSLFLNQFLKDLVEADSISVKINIPERKLVKKRILKTEFLPTIVLGASRSMIIGKSIGKNVSNFSVSGANLQDYKLIWKLLKSSNTKIKKIYLEINPYIFNDNRGDIRYSEFYNENTLLRKNYITRLLSIRYFWDNLTCWNKYSTKIKDSDFILYSDGSIKYGLEKRRKASNKESLHKEISVYLQKAINNTADFKNFNKLGDLSSKELTNLLNDMLNRQIEIILIKYPYPPLINSKIIEMYPHIIKTNQLVDELGELNGVSIIGSFYPKDLLIENEDFYDGLHLKPSGINKIIKSY